MLQTYYFVCLSILLILTEYAQCDSYVRGESDYSDNLETDDWLKLHTAPKTWEEAFLKCQDDGAVLASPLNQGLAYALQQKMLQLGVNGTIFLGTHALFSKGNFVSVEGVPLSNMDIKWDAQDNGAGTGDCLTMSVDGSVHNSSCTDPLPFICYTKSNKSCTCDNEYHLSKQTGSCYKLHLNRHTWFYAYSICASEGGHLVILNDAEEVRIVKSLFSPGLGRFFVGLVSWGKDRSWFTIHGESIENVYKEWDAGEPNNYANLNENRAVCNDNGKLNDFPSTGYYMEFVCEKSPQCL